MRKIFLSGLMVLLFTSLAFAQFKYMRTVGIRFKLTKMSSSKEGPDNKLRIFKPGDQVWIFLSVDGLKKNSNGEIDIESDFLLQAKGDKAVLNKGKILDGKYKIVSKTVPFYFKITLRKTISKGYYYVQIKLTDRVAKKYNLYYTSFRLE